MTTLTIQVDNQLKEQAQKISKDDGVTLTFLITQFLKAYSKGKIQFELVQEEKAFEALSKKLTALLKKKINPKNLPSLEEQLADL